MKANFVKLTQFNSWANEKAIAWLEQINDEQWERKLVSSFPSIKETAIHIASAQQIWVDFWNESPEPVYLSSWFNGSKSELIAIWQKASDDLVKFIKDHAEDELERKVTFVYPHGGTGQMKFGQTVSHIINHTTYHRGQLVTLLRLAGFTNLSSTDLATYYLLELGDVTSPLSATK